MGNYLEIGKTYIKKQYFPHLIIFLILCVLSQGIVSFKNLNLYQSAKVLEMYFSFIGIILLTPSFMPEQNKEIWQLEQSKKISMWKIYVVRIILAITLIAVTIAVFELILKNNNSQVLLSKMWIGAFAETIFLGSIGFFIAGISNQVIVGYMVSVIYYAINTGGVNKFGEYALFQMLKGQYDFWPYMLVTGVVMIIITIIIRERK